MYCKYLKRSLLLGCGKHDNVVGAAGVKSRSIVALNLQHSNLGSIKAFFAGLTDTRFVASCLAMASHNDLPSNAQFVPLNDHNIMVVNTFSVP